MRVDVLADNPLEALVNALGLMPAPVVRVLFATAIPRILVPAIELGVLDAMAAGHATAEAIAGAAGTDPSGTSALLKALNGFGIIRHDRGRYRLTRESRKWLVRGSPSSVVDAILFAPTLDEMMSAIPRAVRTGVRGGIHEAPHPGAWWRGYLRGLASVARLTSQELTRRVRLDNPRRLLDVGGGHGAYAAGFVRRYPALEAKVLDLPPACEIGQELIAEQGLTGRVGFIPGDLRTTPWPEDQDVVLLLNILHNLDAAQAEQTIARAHRALGPRGTLLILDGQSVARAGDLNSAEGFGELFFFSISNSNVWPAATLEGWARAAGFQRIKARGLLTFPNTVLLVCQKG